MAQSFIGTPISLISHSDVRYRGILAGIDQVQSTIKLSNVLSMGTETRRPPTEYIPPVQEPYDFIIFRASEVKDLSVDEPAQRPRTVHDDPAVVGAQAAPPGTYHYTQQGPVYAQPPHQGIGRGQPQPRAPPVSSAVASMETVGRALAGARNGGGPAVPNTEFDFQRANAMFDKPHTEQKEEKDKAYDPQKSFFDSLTGGGGGGGSGGRGRGRGGAAGRNRREEERERNVATFGEPGGVGLLGPGAYVGGWGGHRRGGRGRRGGAVAGARG
ncbi:hypothetical protein K523DRAFT_374881 [Schizophyllum commune Tattone D]|nr:hypothetical protein K523DRAFT_374881 [Schizophyllum commune Tattone D]